MRSGAARGRLRGCSAAAPPAAPGPGRAAQARWGRAGLRGAFKGGSCPTVGREPPVGCSVPGRGGREVSGHGGCREGGVKGPLGGQGLAAARLCGDSRCAPPRSERRSGGQELRSGAGAAAASPTSRGRRSISNLPGPPLSAGSRAHRWAWALLGSQGCPPRPALRLCAAVLQRSTAPPELLGGAAPRSRRWSLRGCSADCRLQAACVVPLRDEARSSITPR